MSVKLQAPYSQPCSKCLFGEAHNDRCLLRMVSQSIAKGLWTTFTMCFCRCPAFSVSSYISTLQCVILQYLCREHHQLWLLRCTVITTITNESLGATVSGKFVSNIWKPNRIFPRGHKFFTGYQQLVNTGVQNWDITNRCRY